MAHARPREAASEPGKPITIGVLLPRPVTSRSRNEDKRGTRSGPPDQRVTAHARRQVQLKIVDDASSQEPSHRRPEKRSPGQVDLVRDRSPAAKFRLGRPERTHGVVEAGRWEPRFEARLQVPVFASGTAKGRRSVRRLIKSRRATSGKTAAYPAGDPSPRRSSSEQKQLEALGVRRVQLGLPPGTPTSKAIAADVGQEADLIAGRGVRGGVGWSALKQRITSTKSCSRHRREQRVQYKDGSASQQRGRIIHGQLHQDAKTRRRSRGGKSRLRQRRRPRTPPKLRRGRGTGSGVNAADRSTSQAAHGARQQGRPSRTAAWERRRAKGKFLSPGHDGKAQVVGPARSPPRRRS